MQSWVQEGPWENQSHSLRAAVRAGRPAFHAGFVLTGCVPLGRHLPWSGLQAPVCPRGDEGTSQDQPHHEMATRRRSCQPLSSGRGPFAEVIPVAADKIPRKETNALISPDHALNTLENAHAKLLSTICPA